MTGSVAFLARADLWLCLAAALLLIVLLAIRWRSMDPVDRLIENGLAVLLLAGAYGFSGAARSHTELILRLVMFATALLYITAGLTWKLVRRWRRSTNGGNL